NGSRKDIIPFFNTYVEQATSVLGIGCGSGYGTYKLKELDYEVTGIDISEKMVQRAKNHLGNDVPLYVWSVDDLPFDDEAFDHALRINVVEWTEPPIDELLYIKSILKQGGMLCAGILGATSGPRQNSYARLYNEDVVMNTMMPWEFFQLAKENGFRLIAQHAIHKHEI